MVPITVGSDTYGSVKKVGGTRIVTQFAMLETLPLYPLRSYYFIARGETKSVGAPFVFGIESSTFDGIPLARLDKLSVAMAYFRGLCGLSMLVGLLAIVPAIMHASGERLDDFAIVATKILATCFVVGVIGGLLSYLTPFQTTARERDIRLACGRILGLCVDPGRIHSDAAKDIEPALAEMMARNKDSQ